MKSIALALFALALLFPHDTSGAPVPKPGAYGFDWLNPGKASCVPLTEEAVKRLPKCEHHPDGAFGRQDPAFMCRVSARSEFVYFANKSLCQANLETMRANAP